MLKKTGVILLVLVLVFVGGYVYSRCSQQLGRDRGVSEAENIKQTERKVAEELATENEKRLVEEMIRSKIQNAKNFTQNISKETQIILLKVDGSFEVSHDRTPENNSYSEWLNNADITIRLDYHVVFAINTKDIKFNITPEGQVEANYDESSINITAIDISNVIPNQKVSVFGKKYTPTEVTALESIAKERIQGDSYSSDNISSASDNLKQLLNEMATSFGIGKITITSEK